MTRKKRTIEMLKAFEPKNGYHLAFSGGKDSQVLYHLCEEANVKFTAYFCRTSVDPPEVIEFIKTNYPNVKILRPKLTMYQIILKHKGLPSRNIRYCCGELKEYAGSGQLVITGIRSEESNARENRPEIEMDNHKNKIKLLFHPIKDWSELQIWDYLDGLGISPNPLYDEGFGRIGCIGCPMATAKAKYIEFQKYPKHKMAYIKTIEKLMQMGKYTDFDDAEDVFNWWISDIPKGEYMGNKKQLKLEF